MRGGGLILFIFLFVFFVIAMAFMPSIFGSFDAAENSTIYNNTHNTTYEAPYTGISSMIYGFDGWVAALIMICMVCLVIVGVMVFTTIRF